MKMKDVWRVVGIFLLGLFVLIVAIPLIGAAIGLGFAVLGTAVGLTILFIGLAGLASWGVHPDNITGLGVTGLLVLLGIDFSLIRLLSRVLGVAPQRRQLSLPFTKNSATKELYAPPQQRMPTLPEGMPSVTEHTTRTFTPAYREPRS